MLHLMLKDGNFKDYLESKQSTIAASLNCTSRDFYICNTNTFQQIIQLATSLVGTKGVLVYFSTNKVYSKTKRTLGGLHNETADCIRSIPFDEKDEVYIDKNDKELARTFACESVISEFCKLNNINSCVFRPGCIVGYKPEISDGFLAKALVAYKTKTPFEVYGSGGQKQVRDQLAIWDVVNAITAFSNALTKINGEVFNIGGGLDNAISIQQLFLLMRNRGMELEAKDLPQEPSKEIPMPYYVTNYSKFYKATHWRPLSSINSIIDQMLIS